MVRKTSLDTAKLYGLGDRGVVAPGYKADLNVLDFEALALRLPRVAYDLPGGARRLVQSATGYVATVVGGEVDAIGRGGHWSTSRPSREGIPMTTFATGSRTESLEAAREAARALRARDDDDAIGPVPAGPWKVPADRYYSPAFAQAEIEKMWPKVWQLAATTDHLAEPGGFFEYRVGPYSVLIVHGNDGVLRAFQNACRHRGNALCVGTGSGLRELKCGYHGWTWDLEGMLRRVPARKGFGSLHLSDYPLLPALVDTWENFVFINMDLGAISLAE